MPNSYEKRKVEPQVETNHNRQRADQPALAVTYHTTEGKYRDRVRIYIGHGTDNQWVWDEEARYINRVATRRDIARVVFAIARRGFQGSEGLKDAMRTAAVLRDNLRG